MAMVMMEYRLMKIVPSTIAGNHKLGLLDMIYL